MKLHLAAAGGGVAIDPDKFERETLAALGMPKEIVMRHRTPHFSHIFSSDGYSAGYYSYLWADTLTADAWEAFEEAGGAYDKAVAKRLYDHVFSVGNTVDPAEAYRAFRGKDPGIDALMRDRGFPVPPASPRGRRRREEIASRARAAALALLEPARPGQKVHLAPMSGDGERSADLTGLLQAWRRGSAGGARRVARARLRPPQADRRGTAAG